MFKHFLTLYFYGVRRNKKIVLEKVLVEDYAAEGKSLARHDGKVIFIENVVPGDVVDIRLKKKQKRLGRRISHSISFVLSRQGAALLPAFWCLRRLPMANASL